MNKQKLELLEDRLEKIERTLIKKNDIKPTNEASPIVAKAIPIIVKNIPLILSILPEFIKALESDQINDNSDKVELLKQFGELGQKVIETFNDIKV